ncbi:MAG TPA: tetratricopeptide repeat protein [Myxococcales bacterium]|nr:tetratricopeptide repeat protein [Myxococcales bacterium]
MKTLLALLAVTAACSRATAQDPAPPPAQPSDVEILMEQVRKAPDDADAWFRLADLHERASSYEEEAGALRKLVELRPQMGYARFKLGTTYNRLGRWAEAVEQFEAARKSIGGQPPLHNNLAVAYGKLGRIAEEIEALEKAIALRPDYATAHYNLGMARLRQGRQREAVREYVILQDIDGGAALTLKKAIDAQAPRGRAR